MHVLSCRAGGGCSSPLSTALPLLLLLLLLLLSLLLLLMVLLLLLQWPAQIRTVRLLTLTVTDCPRFFRLEEEEEENGTIKNASSFFSTFITLYPYNTRSSALFLLLSLPPCRSIFCCLLAVVWLSFGLRTAQVQSSALICHPSTPPAAPFRKRIATKQGRSFDYACGCRHASHHWA